MPHYVYIIRSLKDHKFYIGETADVKERVNYHNSGGQRSTKGRSPFELVLFEEYQNRSEALRREKQIKSWKGGNSFRKLIQGM
jgi:putative endonuclease